MEFHHTSTVKDNKVVAEANEGEWDYLISSLVGLSLSKVRKLIKTGLLGNPEGTYEVDILTAEPGELHISIKRQSYVSNN